MTRIWRWIYEEIPRENAESNMAIDQALFDGAVRGSDPAIRLYKWSRPIVTVGRLQEFDEARRIFPDATLVRRPTGGKAVKHGEDITVTVVAPENALRSLTQARGVLASYNVIMAGIGAALAQSGVDTGRGQYPAPSRTSGGDCFARAASCDITDLVSGQKILGSAQLRSKGIILQQMSLRLGEMVDLTSLDFIDALKRQMMTALKVAEWRCGPLSLSEELDAWRLMQTWEIQA